GHGGHPHPTSETGEKLLVLAGKHAHGGSADRAEAGDADPEFMRHGEPVSRERRQDPVRPAAQRRAASGTTLCNVLSAVSRKRRMLRAACRMRCSFSTRAIRT